MQTSITLYRRSRCRRADAVFTIIRAIAKQKNSMYKSKSCLVLHGLELLDLLPDLLQLDLPVGHAFKCRWKKDFLWDLLV